MPDSIKIPPPACIGVMVSASSTADKIAVTTGSRVLIIEALDGPTRCIPAKKQPTATSVPKKAIPNIASQPFKGRLYIKEPVVTPARSKVMAAAEQI